MDDLFFPDALLPLKETATFAGMTIPVAFRLLSNDDELQVLAEKDTASAAQQDRVEVMARLARALVSVRGKVIDEVFPTVEARSAWVRGWPEPLIFPLAAAYEAARTKFAVEGQTLAADPLPGALSDAPSGDGSGTGASIGP